MSIYIPKSNQIHFQVQYNYKHKREFKVKFFNNADSTNSHSAVDDALKSMIKMRRLVSD